MKDIITALEAKRAAARAGGGTKRHAARLLLALSACVVIGILPAAAQSKHWTDPSGPLQITYATDWIMLEPNEAAVDFQSTNLRPTLLSIRPADWQLRHRRAPYCQVQSQSFPRRMQQSTLNDAGVDQTREHMAEVSGLDPITEFSNEVVDGIRIVRFAGERAGDGPASFTWQQVMLVAQPDRVIQYVLVCLVDLPARDEAEPAIDALFNSAVITR